MSTLEAKANVCCVKFNPESRYHLAFGSAGILLFIFVCLCHKVYFIFKSFAKVKLFLNPQIFHFNIRPYSFSKSIFVDSQLFEIKGGNI